MRQCKIFEENEYRFSKRIPGDFSDTVNTWLAKNVQLEIIEIMVNTVYDSILETTWNTVIIWYNL